MCHSVTQTECRVVWYGFHNADLQISVVFLRLPWHVCHTRCFFLVGTIFCGDLLLFFAETAENNTVK